MKAGLGFRCEEIGSGSPSLALFLSPPFLSPLLGDKAVTKFTKVSIREGCFESDEGALNLKKVKNNCSRQYIYKMANVRKLDLSNTGVNGVL